MGGRLPSVRTGIEIELLAPVGGSRFDLAQELADRAGGRVEPRFHRDTEASSAPGRARLHHLSQASQVMGRRDTAGRGDAVLCRLLDDTTISDDLDGSAPAPPGRYRIIADDPRLIRLVERHADPAASLEAVLDPTAALFGTSLQSLSRGRVRLDDVGGNTVAMAVPQGGQRERVCEVVTPVIAAEHRRVLAGLLDPARHAGFMVPVEAAVHVHLDADLFRSGRRLSHLVRLFAERGEWLRSELGTNPRCRRLGPPPAPLVELVAQPGFDSWPWSRIEAGLAGVGLTKYCDVNLVNLWRRTPGKDTVEIRILPGSIDADAIVDQIVFMERLVLPGASRGGTGR